MPGTPGRSAALAAFEEAAGFGGGEGDFAAPVLPAFRPAPIAFGAIAFTLAPALDPGRLGERCGTFLRRHPVARVCGPVHFFPTARFLHRLHRITMKPSAVLIISHSSQVCVGKFSVTHASAAS